MNRPIINADDYGMHPAINAGIRYCIEEGLIDAVSVAVCGAAAGPDELERLRALAAQRRGFSVGIHLMLTEGKPIIQDTSVSHTANRFTISVFRFLRPYLSGRIRLDDVRREWQAQIERLQHAGVSITHVDSHQHVHLLPGLWRIAQQLAHAYHIDRVRSGYQSLTNAIIRLNPGLIVFQLLARIRFGQSGPRRIRTIGVLHSCDFKCEREQGAIIRALTRTAECELMVHPGFETPDLQMVFGYWHAHWQAEIGELQKVRAIAAGLNAQAETHALVMRAYDGAPSLIRRFVAARARLCPFGVIAECIKSARTILDVGCGPGYWGLFLLAQRKDRSVLGIDADPRFARLLNERLTLPPRARFETRKAADLAGLDNEQFEAVCFIDSLYLLPYAEQKAALASAVSRLTTGGTLLIKETDRHAGIRFVLAYLEECVTVTVKRRQPHLRFYFRSREEWRQLLAETGLTQRMVLRTPCEMINNQSFIFCFVKS